MTVYTIKQGDTLSAIARDYLGDINRWPELAQLNSIPNPDVLRIGQLIQLPDVVKAAATPAAHEPATSSTDIGSILKKVAIALGIAGLGYGIYKAVK